MRFRIITAPRTRASYLMKCLVAANNPGQSELPITHYNEPYNQRQDTQASVNWMLMDPNAVIKHHIRHLYADDVYNSRQYFNQEQKTKWYTILMLRRDIFAQGLSYARSRSSDEWDTYTNTQFWIDTDLFENSVLAVRGSVNRSLQMASELKYDCLFWSEDITGNPDTDIARFTDKKPAYRIVSEVSPGTICNIGEITERATSIKLPDIPGVEHNNLKITKISGI